MPAKFIRPFFLLTFVCFYALLFAQSHTGTASYYAKGLHGRKTSTGEVYDHQGFTCANKEFPRGTILRVTRLDDGRSVDVRVNDCGPHRKDRIVDLSGAAAEQIGLIRDGLAQVNIEVVQLGAGKTACGKTYTPPTPTAFDQQPKPETVIGPKADAPPMDGQGTFRAEALRPITAGFGVQIGSFRSYDNAAEMAASLQTKGYSKVLIRLQGNVHQVILGPFDTRTAAEEYKRNLHTKYDIEGFITEITPD